jgi:hypothetical protein
MARSSGGDRCGRFASYVSELLRNLPVDAPAGDAGDRDSAAQPASFLDAVTHLSSVRIAVATVARATAARAY